MATYTKFHGTIDSAFSIKHELLHGFDVYSVTNAQISCKQRFSAHMKHCVQIPTLVADHPLRNHIESNS